MARQGRLLALLVAAGIASGAQVAKAQAFGAANGGGAVANPYGNPYMNPFVNPYLTQAQAQSATNPALYFLAAQQLTGGMGSGRLSGTRPAGPLATPMVPPPTRRVTDVPGAAASQYFNRSLPSAMTGKARYYNRADQYYPTNRPNSH